MNYYLAASFIERGSARDFARNMHARWGERHHCTSSWLWEEEDTEGEGSISDVDAHRFATKDLVDIEGSTALVLLTGLGDSPGKMVEAGYAMALDIPVYPVGVRRSGSIFRARWKPMVTRETFLRAPFEGRT